jgi:hypothetical protein
MTPALQVSEPINIPTNRKEEYTLSNNLFDPFQKSPPNVFMNHLKSRISKFEDITDKNRIVQTNNMKVCLKTNQQR